MQHARAVDVEAVLRLAGRLVGAVEALDLGAEQAAFFGPTCLPWLSLPSWSQLVDGVAHLLVGAAAADVAGQAVLDLGRAWPSGSCRGRPAWRRRSRACRSRTAGRRSRRTRPARRRACRRRRATRRCLISLPRGLEGEHGAGVDRLAVEHDGAGAAGAAVADALAAGDVEVVAQGVEQRDARLDVGGDFLPLTVSSKRTGAGPKAAARRRRAARRPAGPAPRSGRRRPRRRRSR